MEATKIAAQSPIKWIISSVKSQGRWFYLNIAGSFLDSVVVLFIAYYMRKIVNTALSTNVGQGLNIAIIKLLVLILFGVLILLLRTYSSGRISAKIMYNLRRQLYEYIEKLPVSYLENHHSAEMVSSATNDVSKIENFLNYKLTRIIYIPAAFIITFTYMLIIKWNLLLFSFIVIPVIMTLSFLIVKSLGQLTHQLQGLIGESNSIVQDTVAGMPILKSFNLKDRMFDRYRDIVNKTIEKSMRIVMRIASMTPMLYVLRQVPPLLCIIYGGYLIVQKQMSPGDLLAFLYLLNILVGIIVDIPGLMGEISKASGTVQHVLEILEQPVESMDEFEISADYDKDPVIMKGVDFTYDGETKILDNLNFNIRKGSITALVGPSGSGKSTVFKLLCGYYAPSQGSIELFGSKISDNNLSFCRGQISMVTQDSYLFPVSIAENISYGRLGAGMDEVIAASKAANAHDFIMELPEGYETVVGERGARLSGGQKQRIAIARAILKGSQILLLDEPTSALDNQSEALIHEALEKLKGKKTVLIIAHRLTTIKNADEVFVLKEGSIIEKGTHTELIEKGGFYKQLYLKQYVFKEAQQ
ncbi:MAG: ABC transporter ATP-binding protein/permease [Clostridia bacterium]|nr:ABC transporter ATP-binding protein/permease [Clostridia bacterium]